METSCFYSSFIFIINVLVAFYCGHYLYATLFFALLMTSLLYHIQSTPATKFLDKIAIFSIVIYGGYIFYQKISSPLERDPRLSFLIVFTLLLVAFMYYYGFFAFKFCPWFDAKSAIFIYNTYIYIIIKCVLNI